ncbi:hypothetical protein ACFY0Z_30895, partial [Streptomyces kronopolitis]|uniref:hypothetical protein n=1 Tax=Streptomyces kronopolitis TaxID=1612435 RepID=UPI00367EEDC7
LNSSEVSLYFQPQRPARPLDSSPMIVNFAALSDQMTSFREMLATATVTDGPGGMMPASDDGDAGTGDTGELEQIH